MVKRPTIAYSLQQRPRKTLRSCKIDLVMRRKYNFYRLTMVPTTLWSPHLLILKHLWHGLCNVGCIVFAGAIPLPVYIDDAFTFSLVKDR